LNQARHWTVPLEHPAFAGHFVDMPILPGVVLLDMAIQMMVDVHQIDPAHFKISAVKFLSPAKPGDALTFEQSYSNKGVLNFNITASDRIIATGSIIPTTPA
jgi:3-hydroxyacyl-[acyl-carrier-protein] dehydratase